MHVIPPQSKHFYIRYNKNDRLVPGLTLDCVVEFTPDEWRYYYDCIRIHTKGEENLVIPIHAYPVMSTEDFPSQLVFPPVPVGHRMMKCLPLRCNVPIDFEFQLTITQPHSAFNVDPMSGIVPANGEVSICVTFTPSEFSTAHMCLQLLVSQFNAKPFNCHITGCSAPGLAKEITLAETVSSVEEEPESLDPRCITPVDRIRKRRKENASQRLSNSSKSREVEFDGIKFPSNLDTPYAVAQVLNQEPGKLRMKDIREAVNAKKADGVGSTRQMKEAVFEMQVRQDVYEERQNQLRWQVNLGQNPITDQSRVSIVDQREQAWGSYKRQRGDPETEEEHRRTKNKCSFRRTARDVAELGEDAAKFDLYTNDVWAVRHSALGRFKQAARKQILRLRAAKKVHLLHSNLLQKNTSKRKVSMAPPVSLEPDESELAGDLTQDLILDTTHVNSVTFPMYADPEVKDDMAVDALGNVPFKPTEVFVKENVPFFELKVPQQYSQSGYVNHDCHGASGNYVQPSLVKPLRTGAEDEVISLPSVALPAEPREGESINEGDLTIEEVTTPAPEVIPHQPLQPPVVMFEPIEYPSLHIFNPAPGLQIFEAPLPYGETDSDFHLCPLPRYMSSDPTNPHMITQKKYLDREDVIKGVMSWKKFPSQGLTSLSMTPTLTNVWVPRWSSVLSDDLLPTEVPPLYDSIPEADMEQLMDDEEEEDEQAICLVPEMVNAQFPLIDTNAPAPAVDEKQQKKEDDNFPHGNKMPQTNIPVSHMGPVAREKRERELEYFIHKKYNRLGKKCQVRIASLDNLKTEPHLVLK